MIGQLILTALTTITAFAAGMYTAARVIGKLMRADPEKWRRTLDKHKKETR